MMALNCGRLAHQCHFGLVDASSSHSTQAENSRQRLLLSAFPSHVSVLLQSAPRAGVKRSIGTCARGILETGRNQGLGLLRLQGRRLEQSIGWPLLCLHQRLFL